MRDFPRPLMLNTAFDDDRITRPVYFFNPAKAPFPECEPAGCSRGCERFFQQHGKVISFALYAPRNSANPSRTICAYAFCCGDEIHSAKFTLREGETPVQLVPRVVSDLVKKFIAMAEEMKPDPEHKEDTDG